MSLSRFVRAGLAALALVVVLPAAASALEVKTLDAGSGEQVWYVEDHSLPMIAMTATLPAGGAYDPQGKAGVAAFAAALADEGAGKMDSQAFQTALNSRGIRLSFSPGRDRLTIQLITLTTHAQEAFHLLGLALSKPRFDAAAVDRVRAQILASLKQDEEEPGTIAARAFMRTFFHNFAYGHPVAGTPQSIAAIKAADLRQFASSHWTRGRVHVSVSGDVDAGSLKPLLDSAFGVLPDKPPALPPAPSNIGAPGLHVIAMPVPQPNAVFGLPGLKRADPDFIPAYVANYILGGGGFSSRLMDEVREKRGLTYGISTTLDPMKQAGVWLGQVASKKESMAETLSVVRATLKRFAAEGPTEKELADAKTYLTGSFPLAFDSNTGTAAQLSVFQSDGLPVDYVQNRNALIDAVTAADVKRVAARLFDPSRLTVVVAGSVPKSAQTPAQ